MAYERYQWLPCYKHSKTKMATKMATKIVAFELEKLTVTSSRFVVISLSLNSQNGNSALIEAAKAGKTDIVVELVKAGANLDLQNKVCPVMNTGTQDGLPLGTLYYCLYKNLKHKYS